MKNIDLSSLKASDLVNVHNALVPDKTVKKFASNAAGITAIDTALDTLSKGKANKAALLTAVSGFSLAILALLAPGLPIAKDLAVKVRPAHQRFLDKLLEATEDGTKTIDKDDFATVLGVEASDPKYDDVLTGLYSLNLVTWTDDGQIGMMDASANFVRANTDEFDKDTVFSELEAAPVKANRAAGTGGTRTRMADSAIITLVKKDNPCNPAKERFNHFNAIVDGGTVAQYKAAGGNAFNLNFFIMKGYVTVA